MRCNKNFLFNHLVGALLETHGHIEAERLRGLKIDHQLECDGSLDGKVARLLAFKDTINIRRRAPKIIDRVTAIRRQSASFSEDTEWRDGWKAIATQQGCDLRAMGGHEGI